MTAMQFRTVQQLDITADQLQQWAASRETDEAVALAIHAIADDLRTPEAIWESPTLAESDHVAMAVQNYVAAGLYPLASSYRWGEALVDIP